MDQVQVFLLFLLWAQLTSIFKLGPDLQQFLLRFNCCLVIYFCHNFYNFLLNQNPLAYFLNQLVIFQWLI